MRLLTKAAKEMRGRRFSTVRFVPPADSRDAVKTGVKPAPAPADSFLTARFETVDFYKNGPGP